MSVRVGGGFSKGHTDLDGAFVVQQDVGAGDIAVDQLMRLKEDDALQNLYLLVLGRCLAAG